jgi:hypothetical protein
MKKPVLLQGGLFCFEQWVSSQPIPTNPQPFPVSPISCLRRWDTQSWLENRWSRKKYKLPINESVLLPNSKYIINYLIGFRILFGGLHLKMKYSILDGTPKTPSKQAPECRNRRFQLNCGKLDENRAGFFALSSGYPPNLFPPIRSLFQKVLFCGFLRRSKQSQRQKFLTIRGLICWRSHFFNAKSSLC